MQRTGALQAVLSVQELEMMKEEKGQYERIMKELTQKFNAMPGADKTTLVNKLKQEAWDPTKDAIKVGCIVCACCSSAYDNTELRTCVISQRNAMVIPRQVVPVCYLHAGCNDAALAPVHSGHVCTCSTCGFSHLFSNALSLCCLLLVAVSPVLQHWHRV